MRAAVLKRLMNLWPPFLFSGIHVLDIAPDYRSARVALRRHWYNRNFVGTHFGGSLFAMTDPFWMLLVMQQLGNDYIVWDQAARIDFVAAGRETVFADFQLDMEIIDELRRAAAGGAKVLHWFKVDVADASDKIFARVHKQLYIRRKRDR